MDSDTEQEKGVRRKEIGAKVERFLEQSQIYLDRLPILKRQLNSINHLKQFDLYVQKLDEIGRIVKNLAQNIRNIEELYSRLEAKDRGKLDRQIGLLRTDVDREMLEFKELRRKAMNSSLHEHPITSGEVHEQQQNVPYDTTSNDLRQRHVTNADATDRLNDSYNSLEQELTVLRDTIGEMAQLVALHGQTITSTERAVESAHENIKSGTTFLQRAVKNKYATITSGALIGATLGGPIGFMMGVKIGALAALSGSAVGALSANIMQQRMAHEEEANQNNQAYNQAML